MRKILVILAVGVFLAMAVSTVHAVSQLYGQTEVIYYDQSKAYNGYTLFVPINTRTPSMLIDMEGKLVHSWDVSDYNPQLLENGNLLCNGPREFDWNGNTVFEYTGANIPDLGRIHHDTVKIFNTIINDYTYLFIAEIIVSYEEAIAHGADPECNISEDNPPTVDAILEIDQNGNIVWQWWFWDHIVQNYDPTKLSYGDPTAQENWGKLDINVDTNTRSGLYLDWNHVNSLDYNPTLDQICLNSREHGEFYVIDHSITTQEAAGPAGDFVYRWGNPANYGQGDSPTLNNNRDEQLFGAHDIQWIDDGLPGAGHFLVFENGSFRPNLVGKSYIYEINPYSGPMESGVYIQQHDAGYRQEVYYSGHSLGTLWDNVSNQVVWQFHHGMYSMTAKGFYSTHISGTGRLPNGNTLMCAGQDGHFIEVTAGDWDSGVPPEVVWEYVNPVLAPGMIRTQLRPGETPSVFRCYRYGPDHPAFVGKDMTPMGPITEMHFEGAMEKFQDSKSQ